MRAAGGKAVHYFEESESANKSCFPFPNTVSDSSCFSTSDVLFFLFYLLFYFLRFLLSRQFVLPSVGLPFYARYLTRCNWCLVRSNGWCWEVENALHLCKLESYNRLDESSSATGSWIFFSCCLLLLVLTTTELTARVLHRQRKKLRRTLAGSFGN